MKEIIGIYPSLKLSANIALVGNSKRLLKEKNGHKIDSYEEVVRFNRANTEDYIEFTGKKTTLWTVSGFVAKNTFEKNRWDNFDDETKSKIPLDHVRNLKNQKILIIDRGNINTFEKGIDYDQSSQIFIYDDTQTALLLYKYGTMTSKWHPFYKFFYNKQFKGSWLNLINPFNLSSGLMMILICINSDITPHLYGFDEVLGDERDYHYYLDYKNSPVWSKKGHGRNANFFKREKLILKKLINQKKVVLF